MIKQSLYDHLKNKVISLQMHVDDVAPEDAILWSISADGTNEFVGLNSNGCHKLDPNKIHLAVVFGQTKIDRDKLTDFAYKVYDNKFVWIDNK